MTSSLFRDMLALLVATSGVVVFGVGVVFAVLDAGYGVGAMLVAGPVSLLLARLIGRYDPEVVAAHRSGSGTPEGRGERTP